MKSRTVRRILIAVGILAVLWAGYEVYRRQRGLEHAVELSHFGLWQQARAELSSYLQLHPNDAAAHLMMAELWINDDRLMSQESVPQALVHLQRIPRKSPVSSAARLQEAKLQFLVLHKPVVAEKLLHEAISLEENSIVAHQILIKVLEMTDRGPEVEPFFWKLFELTPADQRAARLRDWYMTQFFPATQNAELDQRMGFVDVAKPTLSPEGIRFMRFLETEPDEPLARAALARWTRRAQGPKEALSILEATGATDTAAELQNASFVATLIDILIDLGEIDRANSLLEKWPNPRGGFDYWRLRAIVLEEQGSFDAALESYEQALKIWPGPVEWRLIHRKAGCLARAGKGDEAVATRAQARLIEQLMEGAIHQRLRHVLGFLDKPEYIGEVIEFYRKLNRTREVEAWSRELVGRVADTLN